MMFTVLSNSHSTWIVKGEQKTSEYGNFQGTFETFREAKREAVEIQKCKIDCFKVDLYDAREGLKEIKQVKKGDV